VLHGKSKNTMAAVRMSRSKVWIIQGMPPVVQGAIAKTLACYRSL
jgi:hypothetical protein